MKTETAKTSKAILVIEIVGLANDYCKKLKAKGHTEKYIKKRFPMIVKICDEIVTKKLGLKK